METWVVIGILTAFAFGISTVLNKVASSPSYFGIEPRAAGLFVGIGIGKGQPIAALTVKKECMLRLQGAEVALVLSFAHTIGVAAQFIEQFANGIVGEFLMRQPP